MLFCRSTLVITMRIVSRRFIVYVMALVRMSISLFSQFFIAARRTSLKYFALAFSVSQSYTRLSPRSVRYFAELIREGVAGDRIRILRRLAEDAV